MPRSSIDFNSFDFGIVPWLFFALGIVFSFGFVWALRIVNKHIHLLEFFGNNSLFVMCSHRIIPMVIGVPLKIASKVVKAPDECGWDYVFFVTITFIGTIVIETVLTLLWNKMKAFVQESGKIIFLKYL